MNQCYLRRPVLRDRFSNRQKKADLTGRYVAFKCASFHFSFPSTNRNQGSVNVEVLGDEVMIG